MHMTKKILITTILGLTFNTLVHSQISQSFKISKNDWGKNYKLTGYAKANDSSALVRVRTKLDNNQTNITAKLCGFK